jgi:hypothetical protein
MVILVGHGISPIVRQSSDEGKVTIRSIPPGDYRAYAFDEGRDVEYADPDWMQQNAGSGAAVTIAPRSTAQLSLTSRAAPPP